jgi:hypothetical protein
MTLIALQLAIIGCASFSATLVVMRRVLPSDIAAIQNDRERF